MTKQVNKRSTSATVIKDRDHQLAAEANEWARTETRRWFDTHTVGFFTPGDILIGLDEREDAPGAWLRWLSDYSTRYQMVRNACVALHKREYLESRQEKNALNRDATGYQRARDLDDWTVVVEGGEDANVSELIAGWLREHKRTLKSVRTIAITRKSLYSSESTTSARHGSNAAPQGKPDRGPKPDPIHHTRSR